MKIYNEGFTMEEHSMKEFYDDGSFSSMRESYNEGSFNKCASLNDFLQ